ncbi:hypothetical protein CAC42_1164 [Sphaceloma murrayae]|uniref:DUF1772-domain-containing protein n=1 Tax=Sphaceloma murrayae TaxID=2082308 RepID=A0A2K1R275_9PEZI|nr:hypothetical protein CAC42_1164 [Sphaceloma murrayae]
MADTTTTTLQALGLSAAFITSGFSFGVSWMVLPSTYNINPSVALPVFKNVFFKGGAFVVPMGFMTALTTGTAAYRNPEHRALLSLATVLSLGPLIFTRLVMMPGINRLLAFEQSAAQNQGIDARQVTQLLQAWNAQNLVRAGLSFTAGALGVYLLLRKFNGKQKRL